MAIRVQSLNGGPQLVKRKFEPATGVTAALSSDIVLKEDFLGKDIVDDGTMAWLFTQTSAAGTDGTGGVTDDALNGVYNLAVKSASSEAAISRIDFGDNLQLDPTKGLYFECRFTVGVAVGVLTTVDILIGLSSAHNAAPDSATTNLWFKLAADYNLLWESDDGTINDDDNDTGVNVVENAYNVVAFDATNTADIKVYVDGVAVLTGSTLSATNLSNSMKLQPYLCINRSAGTDLPDIDIDYVLIGQSKR